MGLCSKRLNFHVMTKVLNLPKLEAFAGNICSTYGSNDRVSL